MFQALPVSYTRGSRVDFRPTGEDRTHGKSAGILGRVKDVSLSRRRWDVSGVFRWFAR
jgi:hypothetical protein